MSDALISCPKCNHEFAVTERLAGPLLAKARAEAAADKAAALEAQRADAQKAARAALSAEMATIEAAAADAARVQSEELERLHAEAALKDKRLEVARAAEQAAAQKEAALAEREAAMEIEVTRKLTQERRAQEEKIRAQLLAQQAEVQAERDEESDLRLREERERNETLKRQIEALKQRADKGSQQLQGEALEVAVEERLAQAFPADQIAPVGKGVRGADCIQTVLGAGAIIWETKRTQNWTAAWPAKLKEDQRRAGSEVAVLVSVALPDGVETFAEYEGVWVCAPRFAVALAGALRQGLISVAQAERRREGQAEKTELLYDYLTGTGFRQRVEALAETYDAMRKTLDQERRAMMKHWAARDQQITRMMDATSGMYGDVQGIAGASLPEIEALGLPEE